MKTKIAILYLILILIISCNNKNNSCHLTGKLENAPDTTTLFLADWESKALFDSLQIINGLIDYNFQISKPKYFFLHNERNQYPFRDKKFIWLEPNEIKIKGDFNFMKNIVLEGCTSQSEYEKYNLLVNKATKQINELKEQIHFKTNEEKKKDKIKIESLTENLSDGIVRFMINHPNSYVTLSSLHEECYLSSRHLNKNQIQKIYNSLSDNLKELEQGIEIKQYMELPEPPKVGDIATEIIQTTPEEDIVKLSDFHGNYVLLNFWDSYCAPCRGEHKWLRKIYNKYNSKGFEILSVSSDKDKTRWINAIKQDSIPWTNISDLKGWKNEAFLMYDIKGIPTSFLINPNGIIIHAGTFSESYLDYELNNLYKKLK